MRDLKYKQKQITRADLPKLAQLHQQKQGSCYFNQVLLGAYSGLTNDPVGLNYFNGEYNIFFQNAPFTSWHGNKSWGYLTTKDLYNFQYHGQAIVPSIPEDIDGVFSGSAFLDEGEITYYYTGNVRTQTGRDAYTIAAKINQVKKTTTKKVLYKHPPQSNGEYRDPFLFKKDGEQYLLCGSRDTNNQGTIYLHKFNKSSDEWSFHSELKVNLPKQLQGYMMECPNLVQLSPEKWVLIFSNEQDRQQISFFHHKAIYVFGTINKELTQFTSESDFKSLNLGPDFYAPQVFMGPKNHQMFGWLGTSQNEQFVTETENWAYDLSLLRNVEFKNNQLIQIPVVEHLFASDVKLGQNKINVTKTALYLTGDVKNEFELSISNSLEENLTIVYKDNHLQINRDQMSFVDSNNFASFTTEKIIINNFKIIIDQSALEMFINDGTEVLTVKFFVKDWNEVKILATNIFAKTLKPLKIDWNNDLFEQI